jgi:hypothetical protein
MNKAKIKEIGPMNQTSSAIMHVLLVRITASVQPVKSENNSQNW